jgi:hypothetical protein
LIIGLKVSIDWGERKGKGNTVNDFHIIEINTVSQHSNLSLGGWLLETLRWFASTVIVTAVSNFTDSIAAVPSSCHDSTPNDVLSIVNDWDGY